MTDVTIVGAGIVGLAAGHALLQRRPDTRLQIVEKESTVAAHQTGRNSGVIHSGIYYKPGSLKAETCRAGKRILEEFCQKEGITYERCGKVIVAVQEAELPDLERIYERGKANGVVCNKINREQLQEQEPYVQGIAAIHVPETGIVDYRGVCEQLARRLVAQGTVIHFQTCVTGFRQLPEGFLVTTNRGEFLTKRVVTCAGLHSDRMARATGARPEAKIIPFRGEYYQIRDERRHLCRNLIYPVPNPKFPFLGVHFTRMFDGTRECGPNAVLALGREAYDWSTVNYRDLVETLTFPGFLRLVAKQWKMGLGEMHRSLSRQAFTKALQRLIPEVTECDLIPAPAGIRAQAVSPDGSLVDDFLFSDTGSCVNVTNAPSPAATAAFRIGELIAERLERLPCIDGNGCAALPSYGAKPGSRHGE